MWGREKRNSINKTKLQQSDHVTVYDLSIVLATTSIYTNKGVSQIKWANFLCMHIGTYACQRFIRAMS